MRRGSFLSRSPGAAPPTASARAQRLRRLRKCFRITLPCAACACTNSMNRPQENAQQDHDDLLIGARDHSRLACTIVEMTGRLASPDAARALHQRGLVRHHDRDESGAFEDWQQALAIARTTKLDVLRARLLVQVGRRLAEQKRGFEQAEPLLAEAVAILEDLEILPGLRYAALCNRAQVLLGMELARPASTSPTRPGLTHTKIRHSTTCAGPSN